MKCNCELKTHLSRFYKRLEDDDTHSDQHSPFDDDTVNDEPAAPTDLQYPSLILSNEDEYRDLNLTSTSATVEFHELHDRKEFDAHWTPYRSAQRELVKVKFLSNEKAMLFRTMQDILCKQGIGHRTRECLALLPMPFASAGDPDFHLALFRNADPESKLRPIKKFVLDLSRCGRAVGVGGGKRGHG